MKIAYIIISILVFIGALITGTIFARNDDEYKEDEKFHFWHVGQGFFIACGSTILWPLAFIGAILFLLAEGVAQFFNLFTTKPKRKKLKQKIKSGENSINIQMGGDVIINGKKSDRPRK